MSAQAGEPTEAELRAYEEELSRITTTQLVLQASASLLNVGGMRLGLAEGAQDHRDLDQVCDAIDAVKALAPILERRMPAAQVRPLRDALSQLQMAYARLAQEPAPQAAASQQAGEQPQAPAGEQPQAPAGEQPQAPAGEQPQAPAGEQPQSPAGGQVVPGQGPAASQAPAGGQAPGQSPPQQPSGEGEEQSPGPAERSGRLWVPGR
jgi:hypothetical protein